jgi:hypothetical protein
VDRVYKIWRAVGGWGGFPSPISLIINPVYGCNLNCDFCSYGRENTRRVFIDLSDLMDVVERLDFKGGVESAELTGGGEPLLHPKILDIVDELYDYGLDIGMITNGTLIDNEMAERLVSKLDWVRVSLYEDSFGRSIAGAVLLMEARERLGSECKITLKFSLLSGRMDWIVRLISRTAAGLTDGIYGKIISDSHGQMTARDADLLCKLEAFGMRGIDHGLAISGIKRAPNFWCWMAPIQATIDPHCNLHYCCNYQFDKRKMDFEWGSKDHLEMVYSMRGVKTNSCFGCQYSHCRIIDYNRVATELLGLPKGVDDDPHRNFM